MPEHTAPQYIFLLPLNYVLGYSTDWCHSECSTKKTFFLLFFYQMLSDYSAGLCTRQFHKVSKLIKTSSWEKKSLCKPAAQCHDEACVCFPSRVFSGIIELLCFLLCLLCRLVFLMMLNCVCELVYLSSTVIFQQKTRTNIYSRAQTVKRKYLPQWTCASDISTVRDFKQVQRMWAETLVSQTVLV